MARAWLTEGEAGAGAAAGDVAGTVLHAFLKAKLHQSSCPPGCPTFSFNDVALRDCHCHIAIAILLLPEGLMSRYADVAYNASHSMLQME